MKNFRYCSGSGIRYERFIIRLQNKWNRFGSRLLNLKIKCNIKFRKSNFTYGNANNGWINDGGLI